jgi:hypothetical protein
MERRVTLLQALLLLAVALATAVAFYVETKA